MLDLITSTKNPLVQRFKSLQTRRGREVENAFLVEGEKLIREALFAGLVPGVALVEQGRAEALAALVSMAEADGAQMYPVARHVLEAACDTQTPSGICCMFAPPVALDLAHPPARLVALDGIQDPGNAGTIWRTADAAGFEGMLFGGGSADALSPKVVRGAMGSSFRVPATQVVLADTLAALRMQGYDVVITSLSGDDIYARVPMGERFVLVIGSEARGVSAAVDALATVRVKLPMRGGAESLNAAVAAGIVMYELTRT